MRPYSDAQRRADDFPAGLAFFSWVKPMFWPKLLLDKKFVSRWSEFRLTFFSVLAGKGMRSYAMGAIFASTALTFQAGAVYGHFQARFIRLLLILTDFFREGY